MSAGLRRFRRGVAWFATVAILAIMPVAAQAPAAHASPGTINTAASASEIAAAVDATGPSSAVTAASFVTKPPSGTPDATSDLPLAAFPTHGSSYGILTTGDASQAANAPQSNFASADDNGLAFHGNSAFDVTDLQIDLNVPSGVTCLRFDFRFLSEEFPEYVGSAYNDAFIAELNTNDWTANGSTITAPHNFAFDPDHNPISINSTGFAHMTAAEADGTVYDGATPLLVAQTPIDQGVNHLYLSIFDQGDHVYDSAAFVDKLSLGTESGSNCQTGAQPLQNLSLSVSPTSAPAGFSQLPKDSLDYGTLSKAGTDGGAALAFSPIPHGPIPHGPIPHGPIPHGPIPHGPIPHGPIPHGAIVDSDPAYDIAPLSALPLTHVPQVLLASAPIVEPPGPWVDLLAANAPALAAEPFQTVTLKDFATAAPGTPPCGADANGVSNCPVTVGDLDLRSSPIGDLSPAALLFSNATLANLGITPPSGFTGSNVLADLEQAGQSLSGLGISNITLTDKASALSNSLISYTLLGSIQWADAPQWNVHVSDIPASLMDCRDQTTGNPIPCDGSETLAQARANGDFSSYATLGQLLTAAPSALSGKTFGQLLPGLISVQDFPFQSVSLDRILSSAPVGTDLVTYTAGADVPCGNTGLAATATASLPGSFRFDGAASGPDAPTVKYGSGSPAVTQPSNQSGNDLTWNLQDGSCTSGSEHVTITFKAEPGPNLGTFAASLHVTAQNQTLSVLDQAPVTTTENFEQNDTPASAQTIAAGRAGAGATPDQPGTLYLDTLNPSHSGGSDVDYFNVPVTSSDVGRSLEVDVTHMPGVDYDLVLYGHQAGATLRGAPIPHGPIPHGPVQDDGACGPPGTVLNPQSLEDVPQVTDPALTIRSYSTNRGTENDYSCAVIGPQDVGNGITVQVSSYGGDASNQPFLLGAEMGTAPTALPCVSVPSTAGNQGPALPAAGSLPASTQTLFLVNEEAIGRFYGSSAESNVNAALTDPTFLGMPNVHGAVLSVDQDPTVAAKYAAWYGNYCSVDAANDVVRAINNLVDTYRNTGTGLPNLKHIVLVGSDAVLPMGRVLEQVNLGSEATQAPNVQFNGKDNPSSAAMELGYMLTDDPYYSFSPVPWLSTQVYPPSVAGGRLVETPTDIVNAINQYKSFGGVLNPTTEFTTGYDFFADGAQLEETALHGMYPKYPKSGPTTYPSQINETWNKTDLANAVNAQPGIGAINGHADQYRLEPAAAFHASTVSNSDLYNTGDLASSGLANGTLVFSIGCHFGESVPDVWLSGPDPAAQDWPQGFANKNSLMAGNTGYGYGDTNIVAYSEKITSLMSQNLNGTMSVGQAIAYAKQQYYASLGAWGVFDAKSVEEFTPYGLPMYVIGSTGVVAGGAGPGTPAPGLTSQDLSFTGNQYGDAVDTGHGSYYKGPTGNVSAEPNRPIEPVTPPRDVTQAGKTLHGAIVLSFDKTDIGGFRPAISEPTFGPGGSVPTPILTDATFPSWFVGTFSEDTVLGRRDTVVLYGGQFISDPNGTPNTGTQRLLSNATVRAYFMPSDNTDFSTPTISSVDGTDNGNTALIQATTPSTDVAAMYVTFRYVGSAHFQSQQMSLSSGVWSASIDTSTAKVAEYFVQMVTNDGNVAVSSFKGLGYPAPEPPPPPTGTPVITVSYNGSPISPSANGVYNKSPLSVNITQGNESFTATVTKSPSTTCLTGQSVPVTVGGASGPCGLGDGLYTIDFTGNQGDAAHTDVNIDTSQPSITITAPANGATYTLGQNVAADYSCNGTGSPIATCSGTVANGSNIDTSSVGTKSFTVSASDYAGNTNSKTVSYKVEYRICLLYDSTKPFRLSGSNVPLKFSLCTNSGANRSSATITVTATQLKRTSSPTSTTTPSPNLLTGNLKWKYDSKLDGTGGGYQYNLKTSGLSTGSYQLLFTVQGDPNTHNAPFSVKP